MEFKPLIIGDLIAKIPIIQGGMGVGISLSNLAAAVANEGGIGVISAAHPGFLDELFEKDVLKANLNALSRHIQAAREKAQNGIIGVNIMAATNKYEQYVMEAVKNKIDLIISGAGLPIALPDFVKNTKTKIAPIISSLKACKVLLKMWSKKYKATADMIIIEGPDAGGHLGFKSEFFENYNNNIDQEVVDIIEYKQDYEKEYSKNIPVVFAGGISSKDDIKHYFDLGCDGVQVSTKFVATQECDAHINFKNAYINCKKEDIVIVKSPVGMPGRAIKNDFIKRVSIQKEKITKCYNCLTQCDITTIPYCITKALTNSAKGDVDNGLVFCGADAYKIDKISTVKDVIQELFY